MWVAMAWQPISSEVSVKGFKQFCVSNAMDKTDIQDVPAGMCQTLGGCSLC